MTDKATVEDLLNEVSYADVAGYQPSEFALKFVTMIKLIHGGDPENKTPVVHYMMLDNFINESDKDTLNMCHRGFAKALSLDTKVYTDSGTSTIGEIKVGDTIYGENGELTLITHKSEVFNKPMYRLFLEDGRTLDVSEDHINVVIHQRQKRIEGKRVNYLDRRELTTKELLDINLTTTRKPTKKNPKGLENRVWLPTAKALNLTEKSLPIDPYTVGILLGDGCLTCGTRFCAHKDDMPTYYANVPYGWGKVNIQGNTIVQSILGIYSEIRELGMNCHGDYKRVPEKYLSGSIEQRTELLMGLMDTDGTITKAGSSSYTSNSRGLCEDVAYLVRSLGGIAKVVQVTDKAHCTYIQANFPLFKLERKLNRQKFNSHTRVPLVKIERIDDCPSQCIAVDNVSHTFVAGDFVVTHNTTVKMYLIWYIALFNELPDFGVVPYALYISDSMDNGVKKMRNRLEDTWNDSPFLQQMIPKEGMKITDPRWEFKNLAGKRFVVTGHGAQQKIRGTVENSSRPVLALLDDLISDEDARSDTAIRNIEATIYNAIEFALHPTRKKVIWSGTPFNARDPLYKAVESGAWAVNLYPVCEKFPCEREEFRGSWEDRFTYDSILKKYHKMKDSGKLDAFNQELMLRIMSDEDKVIEGTDIQWFSRKRLLANRGAFNFYITTDFATSEKKSADYSVISVWAHDSAGNWYWVDGVCRQQLMDANVNDLFRLAQEYQPMGVGIEVTGQQGGFIQWIQSEMLDRAIFFNLVSDGNSNSPGIRPRANKFDRFMKIVPLFKAKKIYLPTECEDDAPIKEAINELGLVTRKGFKSKHDDFIDTISMLDSMKAWRPSSVSGTMQSDGSMSLYDYDDDYGFNNSYIV